MKKIFYIIAFTTAFAACKSKTDLSTNKEMVSLTDSTFYNSSYLTDTGAIANADDFINGGNVISGKSTVASPKKKSAASSGSSNSNSGSGTASSGSGTSTTTAKKTGISKAAKGAIIGGVGGAVIGGVIGKNAKGAIIGGAVGAAGGYIIGRSKDKKDGRY